MKSTVNPLNTGMTMLTRSWIRLMKKVFLTFLRHPVKVTKATDTERGVIYNCVRLCQDSHQR